jgi:uncharacterized protein (DUF302 family)
MKSILFAILLFVFMSLPVIAGEGMINVESVYDVKETADRLENILTEKGMTIFNRINHSEGAANVGIMLPDTELFIFGNPKVGSPLMKCQQTVAIDLPQKASIWEDNQGKVWISYNNPRYLEKRHNISGCEEIIAKIEKALSGITNAASQK